MPFLTKTSEYSDLPWYGEELDPDRDRFAEYKMMVSPTGSYVRVSTDKIGAAAGDGYTLAGDRDFDEYRKMQRRQIYAEQAGSMGAQFGETTRRMLRGFTGLDIVRPFAKGAAFVSGFMSPAKGESRLASASAAAESMASEYEDITEARSEAQPTGVGTAAEIAGMLLPIGAAIKGASVAGRAAAGTRAALTLADASPLTWVAKAGEPVGDLASRAVASALPRAGSLAAKATGKGMATKAAALAGEAAAETVRKLTPHIAAGAPAGALWGTLHFADEYAFGHKPENVAEALVSDVGGHALLFSALGGAGGLVETLDAGITRGARAAYDWWRKDAPLFGETSVRAAWAEHSDPERARTAESIVDRKEEVYEFTESVSNGAAMLVDSKPAEADWLLLNRRALAQVEKDQGSGAVAKFRECKDSAGNFDAGIADALLSNYPRTLNATQEKAFANDIYTNIRDSVNLAEEMIHGVNSKLVPLQEASMKMVGRPGGPPSIAAIETAIDDVTLTIDSALSRAKERSEIYDSSVLTALKEFKSEWAGSVDKIRRKHTEVVEVSGYTDVSGRRIPTRTQEKVVYDPADPQLAYDLLRKARTKYLQDVNVEAVSRANPTLAQKRSIDLMQQVQSALADNIHNPSNWGHYASLRAKYDDAMRSYYDQIENKGPFSDWFLDSLRIPGDKKVAIPVVSDKKVLGFIDYTKKPISAAVVQEGAEKVSPSPIVALAEFRSAFKKLTDISEQVAPDISVAMLGGRKAYKTVAEGAWKSSLETARMQVKASKERIDATTRAWQERKAELQRKASDLESRGKTAEALDVREQIDSAESVIAYEIEGERLNIELAQQQIDSKFTESDPFSFGEISSFAEQANSFQQDAIDRLRLTGEWESLIGKKDFRTRYEPRGHENELKKLASSGVIGTGAKIIKGIVGVPTYQWELEARLRQIAAGQKKSEYLDKMLGSWSKYLSKKIVKPGVAVAKIVSLKTPLEEEAMSVAQGLYARDSDQDDADAAAQRRFEERADDILAADDDRQELLKRETPQERTERYLSEVKRAHELATDANALMDLIEMQTYYLRGSMPETVAQLTVATQALAAELADASPFSKEQLDSFNTAPPKLMPTDEDIRRHERVLMASTADGLIRLLAEKKLTADDVRVAERVIPGIVTSLRMQLAVELQAALKAGDSVDEEFAASVDALVGSFPGDEVKKRRSVVTQTIYNKLRLGKSEKGEDSRPLPGAGKITVDDRSQTDMQRTESRKERE